MSYRPNIADSYRRTAEYVDKLLKRAKAGAFEFSSRRSSSLPSTEGCKGTRADDSAVYAARRRGDSVANPEIISCWMSPFPTALRPLRVELRPSTINRSRPDSTVADRP